MLPSNSLLNKINTFLQKNYHFHQIAGRANILCKYLIHIFFQFWVWFLWFPEAPVSCDKKFLKQFLLYWTSICMGSKSVSQIFKIFFQTGNMILFFVVSFLVDMFNQKVPFLTKKTSAVKSEKHISREAIKV